MGKSWSFVSDMTFCGNSGLETRGEVVISLPETGSNS